jgi:hypothetical protein
VGSTLATYGSLIVDGEDRMPTPDPAPTTGPAQARRIPGTGEIDCGQRCSRNPALGTSGHHRPRHRLRTGRRSLVYGYDVIKGSPSNGKMSACDLYPAPTLRVDPGQTLILHYDNDLQGLTIADYFDPAYTAKGEEVPICPPTSPPRRKCGRASPRIPGRRFPRGRRSAGDRPRQHVPVLLPSMMLPNTRSRRKKF